MFLIEHELGKFVNGEDIQWVSLSPKKIHFTMKGDIESCYTVSEDLQSTFVNHLQALNANIKSVEESYRKANESKQDA